VVGDGWVTIENERYLVINSLRECEEHFKVTKEEGFKFLDDISTNKNRIIVSASFCQLYHFSG
jgi:hypothetical protein